MYCPSCGLAQPDGHKYCPACGTCLPRELVAERGPKVSRWFWSLPVVTEDPANAALRVSCYLEDLEITSPEGSVRVPSHHVRFSIWVNDGAVAAVSIPDHEAAALADFLDSWIEREDSPLAADPGRAS
jgi:hypothetical protein